MKKPEFNVIIKNINTDKIEVYNVFNHDLFRADCEKAWQEYLIDHNIESFKKSVKSSLIYYFWAKYEWEIVVCGWNTEEKLDVYDQVTMNWDIFIDTLIKEYTDGK